jgi:uncharacterized membrane protein YkvA (DUF1232 family)
MVLYSAKPNQEIAYLAADTLPADAPRDRILTQDDLARPGVKAAIDNVKVLAKYFNDLCEIFDLLRDRVTGTYKETPWTTVAALTGALIYVLSPIDLILDFIPGIGFLDDAIVIGLAVKLAQPDLEKYRAWKASQAEVAA